MSISLPNLKTVVRGGYAVDRFALTLSLLQSRAIDVLAADSFPAGTLRLADSAPAEESDGGNSITVRGQGVDAPFTGMAMVARFFLAGGDAAFHLVATGGAGWSFAKSFPLLSGTVTSGFAWVAAGPPRLQLLSVPDTSLPAGLSFNGSLDLDKCVGGLGGLLGRKEQTLTGALTVKAGGASLRAVEIDAPLSEHVDLQIATVDQLTFKVGSNLYYDFIERRYVAVPFVGFSASLPFQARGKNYAIPMSVEIADLGQDFRFQADVTGAIDAGLNELSSLTQGVNLGEFIPEDFHLEDVLRMNELSFDFNPTAAKKLTAVRVGVESTSPWKILHLDASKKDLTVENVKLSFVVGDPLGKKTVFAALRGELALGGAGRLVLAAQYPDFRVQGNLKEGTTLHLAEVIVDFLDPRVEIPTLEILSLSFEMGKGQYALAGEVDGLWEMGPFPLLSIRFVLARDTNDTQANLAGLLSVAGVTVLLSADYESADKGWQFQGNTGSGEEIPIVRLISDLAEKFNIDANLPAAIADFTISDLGVSFNTKSKNFEFLCEGQIPLGDAQQLALTLTIASEKNSSDKYENTYLGSVVIGDWQFQFEVKATDNTLTASLDKNGTTGEIQLVPNRVFSFSLDQTNAPVRKSFTASSFGNALPTELAELIGDIEITPLKIAFGTDKASGNYVFALQLDGGIALSRLPFVGDRLPEGTDIGISDLGLVWCSAGLSVDKGKVARTAFVKAFQGVDLIDDEALSSGGMFRASLTVPSENKLVELGIPLRSRVAKPMAGATSTSLPATTLPTGATEVPATPPPPVAPPDSVKWVKVGKNAGPLSLQRIGLKYADKKVWFLFDVALNAGALTLIVDGLGAGLDLFELLGGLFEPDFMLRGLGLSIKGPAEVSGAFLRDRIIDERGDYDEFSGVVVVKTKALTLSGMGSYADPSWGDPNFFAYAFLDKPIGGPPFFFVTGLALGIAINRSLELPPIDQVSQFPLVRLALGESASPPGANLPVIRDSGGDADLKALLEAQQAMRPYTQPNSGHVVLAVGVRFTTFQILNSFALLVASLDKPLKLDMLISSRMQIPALPPAGSTAPPPTTLIAQIGIDLRGTWIPEDGFLIVEGRITEGSWFLDSACRLSGGAAFASWTSGAHNGDFVMTVGGYHPKFPVPAHYPKVPRLAFNITRGPIEIKGDAYFAMTPSFLMAGGSLSATYTQGDIKAWFDCGADFLVAWEPFSYEASMHVEVGASYRTWLGTVSASVGARLELWGPDLSGIATVDLEVIEFDVAFGDPKTLPSPISAAAFRDRFLPSTNEALLSIGVSDGLIRSGMSDDDTPLFVVNPAGFSLVVESVIPKPDGTSIGIGPMGKTALKEIEVLTWSIIDQSEIDKSEDFIAEVIQKPVPSALWGLAPANDKVRVPEFKADDTVINAAVGFTIKPKKEPEAGESKDYDIDLFEANTDSWPTSSQPNWPSSRPLFKKNDTSAASVLDAISSNPPMDLLAALTGEKRNFAAEVSLGTDWLADLQEEPRVGIIEESVV